MFRKKSKPPALIPPAPSPPPQVAQLFRCDNEPISNLGADLLNCLYPIPTNKMLYGCYSCKADELRLFEELSPETFKGLSAEIRARFPNNLAAIWAGHVFCERHNSLPLLPRCPTCRVIIDRDGWISPVGIWGSSSAGKTVYCAALMMEIDRLLYDWTGLTASHFHDHGKYKVEVGDRFKNNGIIPGKTGHDQRRTLILKLRGKGWNNRKITLTDLAGETYEDWLSLGEETPELRARRQLILWTKEAMFIADPEASPGLRSTMRRDLYSTLMLIGKVYDQFKLLDHYEHFQKQRLLNRMKYVLASHNYPIANDPDPLLSSYAMYSDAEPLDVQGDGDPINALRKKFQYHPYGEPAIELAVLVHENPHESLVYEIADRLNFAAIRMNATPDLKTQIAGITEFISRCGVERVGDDEKKLDRKLAIVVSKADLIPNVLKAYDQFPLNDPDFRPSQQEWREILKQISLISKQILIDFGERQFVELAERNFRNVGFFFVSGCGRDTEEFVKQETAQASRPVASFHMPLNTSEPATPARPPEQPPLPLEKVLVRGPRGGRQPDPQHVLLPLLWILAG
jgi:hypothetical protein